MNSLILVLVSLLLCSSYSSGLQLENHSDHRVYYLERRNIGGQTNIDSANPLTLSESNSNGKAFATDNELVSSERQTTESFHAVMKVPLQDSTRSPSSKSEAINKSNKLISSEESKVFQQSVKLYKDVDIANRKSAKLNYSALNRIKNYSPAVRTDVNTGSEDIVNDLPTLARMGFNFDRCRSNRDCVGGRICERLEGDVLLACPPVDNLCSCSPAGDIGCQSNRNCARGEVCVRLDGEGAPGCVSRTSPIVLSGIGVPVSPSSGSGSNGRNNGLNFDSCRNSGNCRGTRVCLRLEGSDFQRCPPGRNGCLCAQEGDISCRSNRNCPKGELCARTDGEGAALCTSRTSPLVLSGIAVPVSSGSGAGSGSNGRGTGLNFENCGNNRDCAQGRQCERLDDDNFVRCRPVHIDCSCIPQGDFTCQSNRNCPRGEICVRLEGEGTPGCVSRQSVLISSGIGVPV